MVVIKDGKRGKIGPSLKGLFYSYEQDGNLVVKAWPKKRGKPRSQAQAEAQALFKQACIGLKSMPAPFLNYAREIVKGTPMLPRDYLMAAGYGRMQTLRLNNGERRFSMATRVDLSTLLDNIGFEEGMLLYRGTQDLWVGLAVGEPGQVLTVDEAQMPSWQFQIGGGGGAWRWVAPGGISTRAFASKGVYFNPMLDGEFDRIAFVHDIDAGDTVLVGVYRVSVGTTGTIQEILYQQPYAGVIDGTQRTGIVEFDPPLTVVGGQRYVIAISTQGRGATYPTRLATATGFASGFPVENSGGYAEHSDEIPAVGEAFATVSGTAYCIMTRGIF